MNYSYAVMAVLAAAILAVALAGCSAGVAVRGPLGSVEAGASIDSPAP